WLMLGMQSIEQARRDSLETYEAIKTCVNIEVVLRLTDFDEMLYFARRFYGPYFDYKAVKDEQVHRVAIPRSVRHTTRSYAAPTGPATSRSHTELPDGKHSDSASASETPGSEVTSE